MSLTDTTFAFVGRRLARLLPLVPRSDEPDAYHQAKDRLVVNDPWEQGSESRPNGLTWADTLDLDVL